MKQSKKHRSKIDIQVRPKAGEDIKKIWLYSLKNWGKKQAVFYINVIDQVIVSLASHPEKGLSIDYVRENYRLIHCQKHFIIYRIGKSNIEIVRVLGERMDVESHL